MAPRRLFSVGLPDPVEMRTLEFGLPNSMQATSSGPCCLQVKAEFSARGPIIEPLHSQLPADLWFLATGQDQTPDYGKDKGGCCSKLKRGTYPYSSLCAA